MPRPILLIEDDPDDATLALEAAKLAGLSREVVIKRDGAEGVAHLAQAADDSLPDLILLDLMLPKLHGLEVLAKVRADARTREIPVVVLTSSKQPEDVRSAYRLGANAYVAKPVDFTEYQSAVAQIVQFWLNRNIGPFS